MADFQIRTHKGTSYSEGILPTQLLFHQSQTRFRSYIGYVGAGKSLCGAAEALTRAVAVPGRRAGKTLICRANMSDMRDSTWATFSGMVQETCPDMILRIRESNHELRLELKTGWEFICTHLKRWDAFGSSEYDCVWIDECNDEGVGYDSYLMLTGRIGRGRYDDAMWCTGNPAGKNWNYQLFFQHKFENTARLDDHEGFQPGPHENDKNLGAAYWANLRKFWPEEWIKKLLDGSFDVYEGAILTELDPELHLVDAFAVPLELPRYRGLDHGIDHPTACVWIAVDYAGNHIVYREHVKSDAVPASNAAAILSMSAGEEEMIQWTAIDPSTRQRQTAGGQLEMLVDQYRDAGLNCRLANHDIPASVALLKRLLSPDPTRRFPYWHRRAGELGAPSLFIQRDCKVTWHQLQAWKWKAVRPGQPSTGKVLAKDDDTVSALRYCLMERPQSARVAVPQSMDWLSEALKDMGQENRKLEHSATRIGA